VLQGSWTSVGQAVYHKRNREGDGANIRKQFKLKRARTADSRMFSGLHVFRRFGADQVDPPG